MRRIFSLTIILMAAFLCATISSERASAHNIQLHYDLGRSIYSDLSERPSLTTTFEIFRPDHAGSTFMFTDIDYFSDGVAGAYWEVSREFNIGKSPFAAHIEYDGGIASGKISNLSTRFQHAALVGGAWNWHSNDFSRTLSLQAMYKYYFKGQNAWNKAFNSFQATAVWGLQFSRGLISFSGFSDLWYNPDVNGSLIFLSEPQLWLNINKISGCQNIPLSVGTEVEISNNFVFTNSGHNNRLFVIPTLAVKYTL